MANMYFFNENKSRVLFNQIESKKRLIESLGPFTEGELQSLNEKKRIKEIYCSNAIEGNTLSEQETYFIIREGRAMGGRTVRENQEVVNLDRAIRFLEACLSCRVLVNEDFILDLHRMVTSGLFDDFKYEGTFRTEKNCTVGCSINTSTPEDVIPHIRELLKWYYDERATLNPIERAFKFKYRFICIHPFMDGNGKVSSLLMNYILRLNGFLPINIDPIRNMFSYYQALEISRNQNSKFDCPAFIEFMCKMLLESYDEELKLFEE